MNRPPLARTGALLVVLLLYWAIGPVVLVLALASLAVPQVRRFLRPTRKVVAGWVVVVLVLVLAVAVIPDGYLPIPPGGGAWRRRRTRAPRRRRTRST